MTALCSGGSSAINAGLERFLVYATGGTFLLANVARLEWLAAVGAVLGPLTYDLDIYCQSDPPGFSAITDTEVRAFWSLQRGADFDSFIQKVKDAIGTVVWYQSCHCTAGGTPAIPAAPPQPQNVSVVYQGPASTPCFSDQFTARFILTAGGIVAMRADTANPHMPIPFPTYVTVAVQTQLVTAPGQVIEFRLYALDGTGATTILQTQNHVGGDVFTLKSAIPIGSVAVLVDTSWISGSGEVDYTMATQLYCHGDLPGDTGSSCCPPDPALMQMVRSINETVTLLQRNLLPMAYIVGSTHPTLTGSGSFAVSRLVGMKVHVDAHPTPDRQLVGTPPYVWDLGWMSIDDGEGMIEEKRITRIDQLWQPRLFPEAITFGYYLNPGVTASFTELEPEP